MRLPGVSNVYADTEKIGISLFLKPSAIDLRMLFMLGHVSQEAGFNSFFLEIAADDLPEIWG
jgi:hypothetical protein